MSGDGTDDVIIPLLFVFREEGNRLLEALKNNADVEIYMGFQAKPASKWLTHYILYCFEET